MLGKQDNISYQVLDKNNVFVIQHRCWHDGLCRANDDEILHTQLGNKLQFTDVMQELLRGGTFVEGISHHYNAAILICKYCIHCSCPQYIFIFTSSGGFIVEEKKPTEELQSLECSVECTTLLFVKQTYQFGW